YLGGGGFIRSRIIKSRRKMTAFSGCPLHRRHKSAKRRVEHGGCGRGCLPRPDRVLSQPGPSPDDTSGLFRVSHKSFKRRREDGPRPPRVSSLGSLRGRLPARSDVLSSSPERATLGGSAPTYFGAWLDRQLRGVEPLYVFATGPIQLFLGK